MSAICPAKCGKKFISEEHALNHANLHHTGWNDPKSVKRKGWATPYGFGDWKEPIAYEEACEQMKKMVGEIKWPTNQIEDQEAK